MTATEKLCAQMGVTPKEFEVYRGEHPAAGTTGTAAMGAARSTSPPSGGGHQGLAAVPQKERTMLLRASADDVVDSLRQKMGVTPEAFAAWQAEQLVEARRRSRSGEALTRTMRDLLGAPVPAPTTPTDDERAIYARYRAVAAQSAVTPTPRSASAVFAGSAGRPGTMMMVSSALERPVAGGTR